MKRSLLIVPLCLAACLTGSLSGCRWFHRKPPVPDPTEFIVTGAPAGSVLFIDGAQASPPKEGNRHPQVVDVAPGMHTIEVKVGENVAYRESTYVTQGEKHVITVLSGRN